MKNLLNKLDIERIDSIPSAYSNKFELTTNFTLRFDYSRWSYRNNAKNILWKKIDRLIYAGVGKNWDFTYSKIAHLCKNIPFEFDMHYAIQCTIKIPYWSLSNQRWEVREHFYSSGESLEGYIARNSRPNRWRTGTMWVDPITNIVMRIRPIEEPSLTKEEVRHNYEKRNQRRKNTRIDREKRKNEGLADLKMINHPEMYKFYQKLLSLRSELIRRITTRCTELPIYKTHESGFGINRYKHICIPNPQNVYRRAMMWWRYSERSRIEEMEKSKKKLPSIQEQIDNLEVGNYNVFFESDIYLYSLQKECHHF